MEDDEIKEIERKNREEISWMNKYMDYLARFYEFRQKMDITSRKSYIQNYKNGELMAYLAQQKAEIQREAKQHDVEILKKLAINSKELISKLRYEFKDERLAREIENEILKLGSKIAEVEEIEKLMKDVEKTNSNISNIDQYVLSIRKHLADFAGKYGEKDVIKKYMDSNALKQAMFFDKESEYIKRIYDGLEAELKNPSSTWQWFIKEEGRNFKDVIGTIAHKFGDRDTAAIFIRNCRKKNIVGVIDGVAKTIGWLKSGERFKRLAPLVEHDLNVILSKKHLEIRHQLVNGSQTIIRILDRAYEKMSGEFTNDIKRVQKSFNEDANVLANIAKETQDQNNLDSSISGQNSQNELISKQITEKLLEMKNILDEDLDNGVGSDKISKIIANIIEIINESKKMEVEKVNKVIDNEIEIDGRNYNDYARHHEIISKQMKLINEFNRKHGRKSGANAAEEAERGNVKSA